MQERSAHRSDVELVVAARAGDRAAVDELVRAHLQLVYNLVRRALDDGPDADDVVQDVMLRALRELPALRDPAGFRAWLTTIAVQQIGAYRADAAVAARRTGDLGEVAGEPDAGAEVEGATLLRVELSRQRRQVVAAGRWLDAEERALLPLWWLETAGKLTRGEIAAALGVSVAHTGVRLQRMRGHLDVGRSIVAALDAAPGCDRLGAVIADWGGVPSPFWRKRIARHTRECAVCGRSAEGMVASERLLAGLLLFPVPAALAAAVLGKGAASAVVLTGAGAWAGAGAGAVAKAWSFGRFVQAAAAHPVGAAVTAGSLAVGITIATTGWSAIAPPGPPPAIAAPASTSTAAPTTAPTTAPTAAPTGSAAATSAAPSADPSAASEPPPAGGLVPIGSASLESADADGRFITADGNFGALTAIGPDSNGTARAAATFEVTAGLADPECVSIRTSGGLYLRHSSWRLRLSPDEGTVLVRRDATFCPRAGSVAGSVALESANYPGWFLRHVGDELWVDQSDGSAGFFADSAFFVRPPLS